MNKENLKIKILIGIPASGKSTWAINFIQKNPNYIRVNRDNFRLMLKNQQFCEPKIENLITTLTNQTIHQALNKNLNVIIDNTNLKISTIQNFIDEFKYMADIEYQIFDISLEKALERNNTRQLPVNSDVIKNMFKDYKILIDSFDFQPVKKILNRPNITPKRDPNLQDCVIFDVDGTLSFIKNRNPYDWSKVYKDDINLVVAEHIDFHHSKNRKIIILTGRDEATKELTED